MRKETRMEQHDSTEARVSDSCRRIPVSHLGLDVPEPITGWLRLFEERNRSGLRRPSRTSQRDFSSLLGAAAGWTCSGSRPREGRSSAVRGGGETEDGRLGYGRKAEDLDPGRLPPVAVTRRRSERLAPCRTGQSACRGPWP
jgi:hypothetical protein